MKYKVLIISLLLILAVPYGATACGREGRDNNPHRTPTEKEIAEHDEAARRIAEEEIATIPNIIRLVFLNLQAGGIKTVDFGQQFQTLYEGLNIQVTSLESSMNNLTTMLEEISGTGLEEKIANLVQIAEKEKTTKQDLMQTLNRLQNEQAETNALLKILGQRLDSSPLSSVPHETQPSYPALSSNSLAPLTPPNHSTSASTGLSSYQKGLLTRKDQIGNEAWKLLEGENTSLAAALFNSIQQNLGTVEILSLENNSFTLRLNGKEQDQLYRF